MAKTTSEKKSGVAEKAKAAEVKASAAVQADEAKTRENEETETPAEQSAEKKEAKASKGFQFNVSADGFVEVISEKRAGKAVYGTTGDIIKFDEKGYAKVKFEDAMHFSQVPGFTFK